MLTHTPSARTLLSRRGTRRSLRIGLTTLACVAVTAAGHAQPTPTPTAPRRSTASASSAAKPGNWMFEVHGGGFGDLIGNDFKLGRTGSGAQGFPSGTPFTTINGAPSRAVSSWAFGDGVALFDEVRRSFAANLALTLPAITPLDAVMRSPGTVHKPAKAVGARFARNLTSWLAAEISVDRGSRRSSLSSDAAAAVEATRATYTTAFETLLATIPQTGGRVASTATTTPDASGNQTVVTGSAVLSLVRTSRVGVHTIVGGGIIMNESSSFEARLQSNYRFSIFSTFPINESETVSIRFTEKKQMPVGVLGFGATVRVAGRSGIRVDARVLASHNTAVTTIDASASRITAGVTPVSFPSLTTPSLQFSTAAGQRSSLSGDAVTGLVTYSGSGLDLRPHVTVGYYVRF